jgi:hypothetical protein
MNFSHHNAMPVCPKAGLRGVTALLALPAAMSFGVVLARPAEAQIVISADQAASVNLANYPGGSRLSIEAGTTIAPGGGPGVVGADFWSLSNAGTIDAGTGAGVVLTGGGAVANAGVIMGGPEAVRLDAGGTVVNGVGGVIGASGYGVRVENGAGAVTNFGTITASDDGISLNDGGSVINNSGGTISGDHMGVYTGNGVGTVVNAGVISARTGDAVSLYSGGSFSNAVSGRVSGGYSGVYAGGNFSTVQNAGTISGTRFGVYLSGASGVTNAGSISGGVDGIIEVGAGGSVANSGVISGGSIGLRMAADAQVENPGQISGGVTGVRIGAGSVLTNAVGGTIEGGSTGLQAGNNAVIGNAGTISGERLAGLVLGSGDTLSNSGSISGATGILVSGGQSDILNTGTVSGAANGDAIDLGAGGADALTLETGSVIEGDIEGEGSASQILLTGTGTLASDITGFGTGSALSLGQGADWVASGNWTVGSVVNAGILQPGKIGAPLNLTGQFVQLSTGTLRVVVTPTGVSHFNVSGPVQLGGALVYVLAPGAYTPVSEGFLTAGGAVTGSFAQVTSVQPVQQTQLALRQQDAAVVASGQQAAGVSSGQQAPAVELAGAEDSVNVVVTRNFIVAPEDDALFAEANQASVLDAQRAGDVLLGHALEGGAPSCPQAGVMPGGTGTQAGIAGAIAGALCNAGGWLEASGTRMDVQDGYGADVAGFLAGLDRRVGAAGLRLGLAVGYDETTLTDNDGGKANLHNLRIGVYGVQPLGGFVVTGDVMGGFASGTTSRATGAGDAAGSADGSSVSGGVQLVRPMVFGGLSVLPAAGLRIASVSTGALDETARDQAFAVQADASGATSVQPFIHVALRQRFVTASQVVVTPQVDLGVDYEAGDIDRAVGVTTADQTGFAAWATPLDRAAGQAGVGIAAGRGNWALSARYDAQVAGNWSAQTVEGSLQVWF